MKRFRKPYKVRRKKPLPKRILSALKSKKFAVIFIAVILVCLCAWLVLFSKIFQIKHIKISGAQRVSVSEIQDIVDKNIKNRIWFWETKNIFFAVPDRIEQVILNRFPEIIEIKISKRFPVSLDIDVVERNQSAVLIWQDKQFFIDNQGVVFEKIAASESGELKIKTCFLHSEPKLGDEVIEPRILSKIFIIQRKFNKMEIPIKEIEIVSNSRIDAKTQEGWGVYFSADSDVARQADELEMVLKEKIPLENRGDLEYIDLRFDKIFYK